METTANCAKRFDHHRLRRRRRRRRFRTAIRPVRCRASVDGLVWLHRARSLAGSVQVDVPRLRRSARHSADSPPSQGLFQRVSVILSHFATSKADDRVDSPSKALLKSAFGTLRSCGFLATFVTLFQGLVCTQRNFYDLVHGKDYVPLWFENLVMHKGYYWLSGSSIVPICVLQLTWCNRIRYLSFAFHRGEETKRRIGDVRSTQGNGSALECTPTTILRPVRTRRRSVFRSVLEEWLLILGICDRFGSRFGGNVIGHDDVSPGAEDALWVGEIGALPVCRTGIKFWNISIWTAS